MDSTLRTITDADAMGLQYITITTTKKGDNVSFSMSQIE